MLPEGGGTEIKMDIFCEYIVKHKKTVVDYLIIAGIELAAVLLTFIVMLFYNYTFGFGLFIIAAIWYGAYIVIRSRFVEYEYALTNNELDVDKIMAKKRRKHMLTVDFKHIDICAAVNDPTYVYEFNNSQSIAKTYDFSGASEYEVYFADFADSEGKIRILFNPTDKMKDSLRLINPRAVHIL